MASKTIIGTMIGEAITSNAAYITSYAALTTLIIIVMLVKSRKRKETFMRWKQDKINILGIFQRTWVENEDEFLQQLWEENQRLGNENKALRKSVKEMPFFARLTVIALILGVFIGFKAAKKPDDK